MSDERRVEPVQLNPLRGRGTNYAGNSDGRWGRGQDRALPPLPPGTKVLDLRPALRAGQKPFKAVEDAFGSLAKGQCLALRAIFEPSLLYRFLKVKGHTAFESRTHRLAADDWLVVFTPKG